MYVTSFFFRLVFFWIYYSLGVRVEPCSPNSCCTKWFYNLPISFTESVWLCCRKRQLCLDHVFVIIQDKERTENLTHPSIIAASHIITKFGLSIYLSSFLSHVVCHLLSFGSNGVISFSAALSLNYTRTHPDTLVFSLKDEMKVTCLPFQSGQLRYT